MDKKELLEYWRLCLMGIMGFETYKKYYDLWINEL